MKFQKDLNLLIFNFKKAMLRSWITKGEETKVLFTTLSELSSLSTTCPRHYIICSLNFKELL